MGKFKGTKMDKILLESTEGFVPNDKKPIIEELVQQLEDENVELTPYKKQTIKTLLNNEAAILNHLASLKESGQPLTEGLTTAPNIAPYETYIYPILIRAMIKAFGDQLVSVQPIQSTYAMVRILKTIYGDTKGKVTEGDLGLQTFGSQGIVFSPYYTSPFVDGEPFEGTTNFTYEIKYPVNGAITVNITTPNAASFSLKRGESTTVDGVTYKFLSTNVLDVSAASATAVAGTITYLTNLEAKKSASLDIAIEKLDIHAEIRRLYNATSIESILELKAHGVDYQAQILELLSSELAIEMDRTIIFDIIGKTLALGSDYVHTFTADLPTFWNRPVGDFIRNLYYLIMIANAKIFKKTRRIPGNWIVTSPIVAAALEAANYIVVSDNLVDEYSGYGFFPLGVVRGLRNKIFVDASPAFPDNYILVGAKGPSPYDAGYVYAPYAPVIPLLNRIFDIEVPAGVVYMAVYQAAGFRMVDNGFYRAIRIEGAIDQLYNTYYTSDTFPNP